MLHKTIHKGSILHFNPIYIIIWMLRMSSFAHKYLRHVTPPTFSIGPFHDLFSVYFVCYKYLRHEMNFKNLNNTILPLEIYINIFFRLPIRVVERIYFKKQRGLDWSDLNFTPDIVVCANGKYVGNIYSNWKHNLRFLVFVAGDYICHACL